MKYVLSNANLNSLSDDINKENCIDLMLNYRRANELTVLNPLGLDIIKFEEAVIKFYNTIDFKLMEFNNTTSIQIDSVKH
jgi:hypothetical protein